MEKALNAEYFAYCAMPAGQNGSRSIEQFFMTGDEKFLDEQGNEFIVVPFSSGHFEQPQQETTKSEYFVAAEKAIKALKSEELKKVVISRLRNEVRTGVPLSDLFELLVKMYPSAFVYYLNHPEYGVWIGATPELLLEGRNTEFRTVALAGTRLIDDDSSWNDKLKDEQQMVTDFIDDKLKRAGIRDIKHTEPYGVSAGPLQHLKTEFSFSSGHAASLIANTLNPTSAVCGLPRDEAYRFIISSERHERRLYTGYLGINRSNGDVDYYVNLRCMQVFQDHFEIYAGGGLTAKSQAAEEWLETEHKTGVLLKAIQSIG